MLMSLHSCVRRACLALLGGFYSLGAFTALPADANAQAIAPSGVITVDREGNEPVLYGYIGGSGIGSGVGAWLCSR